MKDIIFEAVTTDIRDCDSIGLKLQSNLLYLKTKSLLPPVLVLEVIDSVSSVYAWNK